ncbi:hypothetical protein KKB43_03925 [Patescibacteria group bacterium]|nr:hypothetical protein [Patescibacteria group bacterium]
MGIANLIYFIIFFIISWLIAMKVFSFSTYHKHFFKALPVLIIYSALLGYLLDVFELHAFFLWFLIINIVLFVKNYKRYKKQDLMEGVGDDYKSLLSEEKIKKTLEKSTKNTLKYFIISSVVYLVVFSATYLFFFNDHLWK